MIAATIEYVLRDCGFDSVDIASSSTAGVRAAAPRCPDLLPADITLSEGDGIEAIRSICREPSIPVIFITGRVPADVRQQVADYPVLSKPFSQQTLTYTVAAALGR